ncbi:DUF2127 domain-containing protein [Herbaspirillum sp. ST 5-3]|uniref:DUF2127 domain-containing protein n=1 Tax=Oxalobacteraceae TaxID=75682 RepID=UPI001455FC91|nr:DUF2127 domain-containing protein [Herbaspirillum sp. ST 5-3]
MIDPKSTRFAAPSHRVAMRRTLRAIAAFEAIKGLAAFAAVIGVLDLVHHDVRHLAMELIGRFHLNPAAHYPSVLLHYANLLPGADLHSLFLLASAYIAVRLLESYGLWNDYAWGEWLGTLSGGIYIPFEFLHLLHRPSMINGLVLAGNMFLVGFLTFRLWRRHRSANDQIG